MAVTRRGRRGGDAAKDKGRLKTACVICTARLAGVAALLAAGIAAGDLRAQDVNPWQRPTLNAYGAAGLIDMPSGLPMPDGELSFTLSATPNYQRNTLSFQISPRLSGSFRFSTFEDTPGRDAFFDRSLDLRYQLSEESLRRPAVTVGLQDFGGTGIYSGEYVAATKTFGRLQATAGIGWGRFGSYNGFDNPLGILSNKFDTRPEQGGGITETGQLDGDHWFRGDAALFAGLQYAVNDQWIVTAEYSSDAYDYETNSLGLDRESPWNFGATYRFRNGLDLSATWRYGTDFGLQLSYGLDATGPNRYPGGIDPLPVPVAVRAPGTAADLGWTTEPAAPVEARASLAQLLSADGIVLEQLSLGPDRATVRFRNPTYVSEAQAVGRVARAMSATLPASVETFEIIPVTANGVPASRIAIARRDLEELEFAPDGAWDSFARAQITDATTGSEAGPATGPRYSSFSYYVGPYIDTVLFDANEPLRATAGIEARLRYEPAPGWVLDGQFRSRLAGNVDTLKPSNSVLPRVRTDIDRYLEEGENALTRLTVSRYFRPGPDLYGRITAGYLEPMYGGISGELLWKPVDRRLGLGVELNYARQRDFDQQFGFQDYDIVTGHVSAYWDAAGPYHYQIDAGRYLAGDWGATFTVDREFGNGIRVGAFATFTDVSFEDFGEGSFDKGIRVEIPVSALTGTPTQQRLSRTVRPVLRDGGARLEIDGRLYETVRGFHEPGLQDQWGRFWR